LKAFEFDVGGAEVGEVVVACWVSQDSGLPRKLWRGGRPFQEKCRVFR